MTGCVECGKAYIKIKPWQKYCNTKCKDAVHRRTDRYKLWEKEYMKEYKFSPVFKYNVQKQGAKRRGIDFLLTFEEWWNFWEPHWENRGTAPDNYCMARFDDTGPYVIGNVYLSTISDNCALSAGVTNIGSRDKTTGRFINEDN